MPTVSTCCGLKLGTGALAIGYFEVIISFIGVVLSALLMFHIDELEDKALCRNVSMIAITVSALTMIVGLFLTIGIINSDISQIKPWVVIKGIMLCFEVGVLFLTFWILYLEYTRKHHIVMYILALAVESCVTGKYLFQHCNINNKRLSNIIFSLHLLHDDCSTIILQDNANISSHRLIL